MSLNHELAQMDANEKTGFMIQRCKMRDVRKNFHAS